MKYVYPCKSEIHNQVVFGTVVTRGPRSPLAVSAMAELEQACVLFSKAAVYSKRATKALVSSFENVRVDC